MQWEMCERLVGRCKHEKENEDSITNSQTLVPFSSQANVITCRICIIAKLFLRVTCGTTMDVANAMECVEEIRNFVCV